jgi:hypothetical protein
MLEMLSIRQMTRVRVVVWAVLACALAFPQTVLADTPIAHSGLVGPHYLTDNRVYPGAQCRYTGLGASPADIVVGLFAIRVRPPVVYAFGGRDRAEQVVGWRIWLQRRSSGSTTWKTVRKTKFHFASAFVNQPATFKVQAVPIPIVFPSSNSATRRTAGSVPLLIEGPFYRVEVEIGWQEPRTTHIEGKARHRVDYYKNGILHQTRRSCADNL